MGLSLVTVRARTRGKAPVLFTYEGIGKLVPRKVIGKGGKAIQFDGKDLTVDDLDVDGFVDDNDLDNVLDVTGGSMARMLTFALVGFNMAQRDAASPVSEGQAATDELTDMVNAMIAADILTADTATVWRRSITQGAQAQGVARYNFAVTSKYGRKLAKTGWEPNPDLMSDDTDDDDE